MAKHTININGVIGKDVTLAGFISSIKALEDLTELEVVIDSPGGSVDDGRAMYDYLKSLDTQVTTVAKKAYSIAATVFMAGEIRLVEDVEAPIMVHMPLVANFTGRADDLDIVSEMLKELEAEFTAFYSELLDLPEDTVETLLKNETFTTPEEAVSLGLATGIKPKIEAIAFFNPNINKSEMTETKKTRSLLEAIAQKLGILKDPELKALEMTAGDGETVVDFYELSDGETPVVGSKARVDGSDADGEIVMPSGETYVFVSGELTEIKEPEEEPAEPEEEPEANADPVAEQIKEVTTWEVEVNESNIQEGTALTYTFDGETYSLGAGEFILKDGRSVITDASGTVVKVKEAPSVETPAEEAPAEEAPEANADLSSEILNALVEKNEKLEAQLVALQKSIVSPGLDAEEQPKQKPFNEMTALEKRRYFKNLENQ